jgi:serine protease Do
LKYPVFVFLIITIFFQSCSRCSRSSLKDERAKQKHEARYNERAKPEISPVPDITTRTQPQDFQAKSPQELVSLYSDAVFMVVSFDHKEELAGQGTGFYINAQGYALSNYHVMHPGEEWVVKHSDGSLHRVAQIIRSNQTDDLILFRVENRSEVSSIPMASSDPSLGEDIVVIGNPQGLENTITKGIISAFRYNTRNTDLIQIDAAISPGSSGSPVINLYGQVIGIATLKIDDCENCNFAVSWRKLQSIVR